ncbi:MAG: murein biosynthesis integral membrane protein MurJ [Gemmatimonadota bacterium]
MTTEKETRAGLRTRPAFAVGAGIFLSRIVGFVRDAAIAAFFGTGLTADAYTAALRIPNILRNLLGEGTLSASFIPVYSGLLARGAEREGRRLAGTILGILLALAALLSALGILLAPWLTRIIVPGWSPDAVGLTARLVRILFPMAGFMILAAWSLGILNSHRRFFLPFAAPILWNLSQIAGLLIAWRIGWEPLVVALAWSTLIGGALQFFVQLPAALKMAGRIRLSLDVKWEAASRVLRNLGPVVLGAGAYQISSLLDVFLASFLVHGAVATLYFSQRLYFLPVSLFGISVAASALPELSRDAELENRDALKLRLRNGFRSICFTVIPSAFAFILFGDWIVSLLFERGTFGEESRVLVHATLAAYAVGLLAAASAKLFASGYHAMLDTRTPVKFAVVGLSLGAATGAALMWPLYAAGLALGGAVAAWTNVILLWAGLDRRLGAVFEAQDLAYILKIVGACVVGAVAGLAVEWLASSGSGPGGPLWQKLWVTTGTLGAFGVVYLATSAMIRTLPMGGLRAWTGRAS